jgi:amidase
MYDTRNPVFGVTKNPYDPTKSPGGSSGGAAAIVAACGSPFDIGTDSGGSIRFPAGLCGIAGLKPTLGRVPQTGCIIRPGLGVIDELNHVGPMARFVDDLFPILEIIAGPDGRDASVVPVKLRRPSRLTDMQARQPLRVAFYTDNGFRAADADVKRTVESVASELVLAKLRVEEKRPEALARLPELYLRVDLADGLDWFRVLMKQCNTAECDPDLAPYLNTKPMSGTDFAKLLRDWHLFRAEMLTWMQDYDAVVCPVSTMSSLPSGFELTDELGVAFYDLYAFNLLGWPVAVVRCGSSDEGMPIGVQIAAKPWREDVCLAIAKHLETELGGWKRPAI